MKKILYSFLFLCVFINLINAQQQKISFENSEGYHLGTVVGQNGWTVKTDMANNNFKVVTGNASDGVNSVEVTSNGNYTENNNYLEKKIPYYDKFSISADVKLEALDGSDYYMLSLYSLGKWTGGFNFTFDGALYADSNVTIKYIEDWIPGKWYKTKIIVDHTKKTIDYYLDGNWVFVSPFDTNITKVDEVNFEFDNFETGFIVDNILIENLSEMSVSDTIKSTIEIYPNPFSDYIKVNSSQNIKSIKIYDNSGKLVKNSNHSGKSVEVNVSELPKGIYFISLETNLGTETKKMIKE